MKLRIPDHIRVYTSIGIADTAISDYAEVKFAINGGRMAVSLAVRQPDIGVSYIRLRWNRAHSGERRAESVMVYGDAWERGYGDLMWGPVNPQRTMPWFCMASNGSDSNTDYAGRFTECFGVGVLASALVFWQYDTSGVTCWLDVRSGTRDVLPGNRVISVCDVIFGEYRDMSAYTAGCLFCAAMSPSPLKTARPVYGSNDWYYAYGKTSHEEIMNDTRLLMSLCKGNENPPYMVIDNGWSPVNCDAPWDRGNEKFPDMARLASEMAETGAIPGIWVRYLIAEDKINDDLIPVDWRAERCRDSLDPSIPEVLEYVRETTKRLTGWGYKLIKHDFSTYDMFGCWALAGRTELAVADGGREWSFRDRSKTSAEVIVNLNRVIREAAGPDTVIIGCNVIGHLAAGLIELNRTGDDTSGRDWERTRRMGVNTLAFRGLHNGTFYAADADCVGLTTRVSWDMNARWTHLLAVSGSPMFVSAQPEAVTDEVAEFLREAYRRNSIQTDELIPLDWMENMTPARWLLNGQPHDVDWFLPEGADSFRKKVLFAPGAF